MWPENPLEMMDRAGVVSDPGAPSRCLGTRAPDRGCAESRLSGLRGDALADDGLSRHAETVPARHDDTGPIRTVTALHRWMDRARASGIA